MRSCSNQNGAGRYNNNEWANTLYSSCIHYLFFIFFVAQIWRVNISSVILCLIDMSSICTYAKRLTLYANSPQDVCFCKWVEFSSLSDKSTYQYNCSKVNHVKRKRQRVHLFAFFLRASCILFYLWCFCIIKSSLLCSTILSLVYL